MYCFLPLTYGKSLSQVMTRMPSVLCFASTTTPSMLTVCSTLYRYGLPSTLLFGYHRCGLLTWMVSSNTGVSLFGTKFGGNVFCCWSDLTTLPSASTICVVNVTDFAALVSFTTLVCTLTVAV